MDIKCKYCGEPWDTYTLHEMADYRGTPTKFTYEQAYKRFRRLGCGAFEPGSEKCRYDGADFRINLLQDLLGDDVDGVAADLEDFRL